MTDLANNAAAVSAGYQRIQTDFGASISPRYTSRYEKPMVNADAGGYLEQAQGESDAAQATADTNALAALNGQRRFRYGADSVAGHTGRGGSLTFDA